MYEIRQIIYEHLISSWSSGARIGWFPSDPDFRRRNAVSFHISRCFPRLCETKQSQNVDSLTVVKTTPLCSSQKQATTNTNSPPSAEWMMTTLLNGPSPLLLYTPTFTSKGVSGGNVSSLYLYVVESAEVTIFSFQPLVPLARNATIYPKPSPFWNSSETGWKHRRERSNHGVSFTEIKCALAFQHFSSVTEGALFANLPHLNSFFWASKALIEQKTYPSMAVPYNQLAIYCNCLPVLIKMQSVSGNGNKSYLAQLCPLCSYLSFHVWQEDFWDTGFVCRP